MKDRTFILRHLKAPRMKPDGSPVTCDEDRVVGEDGVRQAEVFRKSGLKLPGLVICSDAKRCEHTAQLFFVADGEQLPEGVSITRDRALYTPPGRLGTILDEGFAELGYVGAAAYNDDCFLTKAAYHSYGRRAAGCVEGHRLAFDSVELPQDVTVVTHAVYGAFLAFGLIDHLEHFDPQLLRPRWMVKRNDLQVLLCTPMDEGGGFLVVRDWSQMTATVEVVKGPKLPV